MSKASTSGVGLRFHRKLKDKWYRRKNSQMLQSLQRKKKYQRKKKKEKIKHTRREICNDTRFIAIDKMYEGKIKE